jgi:glycosyltransferase involved in cell wall biosynthesis
MKITIITPSFNQADFLEQTIKSVVSQSHKNIEYLIFDADSTDGSVDIIKKYAKKYPKLIKWQSKKDKGQVDALNKGLKVATGDVIAYINSDDYYLPGAFNKVVATFEENPSAQWLVGNCQVTAKNLSWTFKLKHLVPIHKSISWLYLSNWINQPAVFLRKDLVSRVGKFNPKYNYAFDYDYWLRCSKVALPSRLKQNLAVFRVHSQSKGSSAFKDQFKEDYLTARRYSPSNLINFLHYLSYKLVIYLYTFIKR